MDTRLALGVNPLVIPDQSQSLQKALTLNALLGQSDLQGLQFQEAKRTLAKNQALDALAQTAKTDEEYMSGLQRIDRAAAYKLQNDRLNNQKTQGEVDKFDRENDAANANAILNASAADRPIVYAKIRQQEIAKGNKAAAASPAEWNESFMPHIVAQQQKGLATKDSIERQDIRDAAPQPVQPGMPTTPPVVQALQGSPIAQPTALAPQGPPPASTLDMIGQQAPGLPREYTNSGVVIPQAQGLALAAPQPGPSQDQKLPQVNVDAVAANPRIAEYRAEADRQRAKGTKAGNENAKTFMDEAARLEDLDVKQREKFSSVNDAPGVVYNKATGEFSMNGKPISAEDIQKVALAYAEAKGTKLTVENYPNPTTVTDPKTGEQKSVQFGKSGSYREVPYKPPSNDSERLSAGYHDRMLAAEKIISDIGSAGNPTVGSTIGEGMGAVPGRVLSSTAQQQYKQAQSDWVRAKLRKESGAVIGPKEMQDEIDTYFPRLGDGPEVIKQKADARAIAQEAMLKNAGPAATGERRRASDKVKTIRFEDLP